LDQVDYEKAVFPRGFSLYKTKGKSWFNHELAQRAVDFFPLAIRHVKGRLAGTPFYLERWQNEILASTFGWQKLHEELDVPVRRIREVYIEAGRKQAKSLIASGVALLALLADGERAPEVISCAADRSQANIVFEMAQKQVLSSPVLSKMCKVYRNAIEVPSTGGVYRAISSETYTKWGLNISCIIFDEMHAIAKADEGLYDILRSSMVARSQPLIFTITNAGFNRASLCYKKHQYALGVIDNTITDD
jgi:phage terminase large subunit-like protein